MKFRAAFIALLVASGAAGVVEAAEASEWVKICDVYGDQIAPPPAWVNGIGSSVTCPGDPEAQPPSTGGMALWTDSGYTLQRGSALHWTVTAPPGLTIASVYIPHMYSAGIDDNTGWGGGFFWSGGSSGVNTWDGETGWSSSATSGPSFTWPTGGTPYFGWQVVCGWSTCSNGGYQWLSVELLELNVTETTTPTLSSPDGIWASNGWIRGSWRLHYGGDSPSGVCSFSGSLNGHALPGSSSAANTAVWHQCAAPAVDTPINTAQYGQGALPLVLTDTDAAWQSSTVSRTVDVDNQTPTISLSGPTDATTTAGTQYVTATATAGPSGVAGISCSVDGAPAQWYPEASVQLPIDGVGVHHVSCSSENRAHDASGNPGVSSPGTWTLSIRQPTLATVDFARLTGRLRCRRVHERVRIPAHWVTAYRGGHAIHVLLPAQTRRIKVTRCHARVVIRHVKVDGHWKTERIVEFPHIAVHTTRRLRPGQSTTVSGWLGTSNGTALAGQPVTVYTAPADASGSLTPTASATTTGDGTWTARLPPGPSRTVVAVYGGGSTVEPATSAPAHVVVPAAVSLRISPTTTHWGGRIRITGRLAGGYIPAGGELVVLWVGWHGGSTEIGHVYTSPNGRFATRYTFLRGNGTERYGFWAASVRESDYPFAPGRSRRVGVTVRP